MGRFRSSCFNVITCGGNPVNSVALQTPPEYKASSGWREWVFRSRCPSHKMCSNTVIIEASSSAKEDYSRAYTAVDESSIIVIQAAIRGYLAHRVLLKQTSAIKLQATIRGHLVRRHAVGTLLCIQAIVKLQVLLRKRRAHLLKECSGALEKQDIHSGRNTPNQMSMRSKGEDKSVVSYTPLDKLHSNKFAHRLMASAPRTKRIYMKCEPSKSDSAWKWLERWTSFSSGIKEEPQESGLTTKWHEQGINNGHSDGKGGILVPSESLNHAVGLFDEMFEDDDFLITYDVENLDLYACSSISLSSSFPRPLSIDESYSRYDVTGDKQCMPDPKELSSDKSDKFSQEDPALTAIQSKFNELNSGAASAKLTSLLSDSMRFKSSLDKVTFSSFLPARSSDIGLVDASISNGSADQIVTSGCGTELSISSTLDSPDRSDGELTGLQQELKTIDLADQTRSREVLRHETNGNSPVLGTESSYPRKNHSSGHERGSSVSGEFLQLKKKLEADQTTAQVDFGSEASHLAVKPSTEASPGRCLYVTESRALLSRQVSFQSKKSTGASGSNHTSPSLERQLKEPKTEKRRNSFGLAKPEHERDTSSSNDIPSYMQATESTRAKTILNGPRRSTSGVLDKDMHIYYRGSPPVTNVRYSSPRLHRSLSQTPQNPDRKGKFSSRAKVEALK